MSGDVDSGSHKLFLVTVQEIQAEKLLNFTEECILPGLTITSHCWDAYNILADEQHAQLKQPITNVFDKITRANTGTARGNTGTCKKCSPQPTQ
jgi:hypothetical protein